MNCIVQILFDFITKIKEIKFFFFNINRANVGEYLYVYI
jgi:hypothetical protein